MSEGFPLLTTKKMYMKGIITELLWFLRGDTSIKYLVDNDCHIWDGDCYQSYLKKHKHAIRTEGNRSEIAIESLEKQLIYTQEEFIDKIKTDGEFADKWGSLGKIYGHQWRRWETTNVRRRKFEEMYNMSDDSIVVEKNTIDQISILINDLKTNPDSRRLMVNAWNVADVENGSMVLPPCFSEDMMVCCIDGYRKISELTINDLVLTEDGSYQKVYDLHETSYNGELLNIKIHGNNKIISVTPNHPFLIKKKGYITASEIDKDDYVGIPINKNQIVPSFDTVIKDNQYSEKLVTTILDDIDYWFLMGYYMGDGWLINSKEEVCFSINNNQVDEILPRLKKIIGLAKLNNSGKNCTKYVGKKKQVFEILSKFGKYAEGKFIPQFVHDAPKYLIDEFIKGYLMADGCITKDGVSYTTVSENIAFGLQLLYTKLGVKASVFYQKRLNKKIIEGREVNQKNTFSINVYKQKNNSKNYIFDENYLWLKITNITSDYKDCFVYNISTENNHTYNVYNVINHNCHYGFQMYTRELSISELNILYNKRRGIGEIDTKYTVGTVIAKDPTIPRRTISLMWNQRSVDTGLGLSFNIASYSLLLMMIAKQVNMVPDELIGNLGDVHLYLNHIEPIKEQLTREPYELPTVKISDRVVNDISEYTLDDIILENYQSHPAIKMPLSN
jgi:thymidylate synthase/intein/homing endonuclease